MAAKPGIWFKFIQPQKVFCLTKYIYKYYILQNFWTVIYCSQKKIISHVNRCCVYYCRRFVFGIQFPLPGRYLGYRSLCQVCIWDTDPFVKSVFRIQIPILGKILRKTKCYSPLTFCKSSINITVATKLMNIAQHHLQNNDKELFAWNRLASRLDLIYVIVAQSFCIFYSNKVLFKQKTICLLLSSKVTIMTCTDSIIILFCIQAKYI